MFALQEEEEKKTPLYPKLSALEKEQVKRLFSSFKNSNPKKRKNYEDKMIRIGRGAIPALIEKVDTKHEDQGECIYNCLVTLMNERDTAHLKKFLESKTKRQRLLAAVKYASFQKPEYVDPLKKALEDEDEQIRLEAALGLVAVKDPSGLGEIILAVSKNRKSPPPRLLENLPNLKSKAYKSHFTPYLVRHKDPEVRISAANVIGAIGDIKLKDTLVKALDDPHNIVKTATVNALRKLIRNEPPREFKNVFELVEAVNQWKKDLGLIR